MILFSRQKYTAVWSMGSMVGARSCSSKNFFMACWHTGMDLRSACGAHTDRQHQVEAPSLHVIGSRVAGMRWLSTRQELIRGCVLSTATAPRAHEACRGMGPHQSSTTMQAPGESRSARLNRMSMVLSNMSPAMAMYLFHSS